MAVPLAKPTADRLVRLFPAADLEEARALLEEDCAENVTGHPALLERIRYAVLKSSGGTIAGLVDAIVLAQTDWRDALVVAGFADDPLQHESWWPDDAH